MATMWVFGIGLLLSISLTAGMPSDDPCQPNPCGRNSQCYSTAGRPVCSCLPGHFGNPLSYCQRGECQDSSDCGGNRACRDYQCVDVCAGSCGVNADCRVRNHVPVCSCPARYTGDPFTSCRLFDPQELCQPSPCGANTKCTVVNGTPVCACLEGYVGSPLSGCRHECESDYECAGSQTCRRFRCEAACTSDSCAPTASCAASNHRAVCTCPTGYMGDPYISCHAECLSHGDCPASRPACLNSKCVDPCAGVCGVNADCRVRDSTTAICSCPRHMTGNPFVSCRPFEKSDLCIPNPCGANARCDPGHDRSGRERPVCTCVPGYTGDPLSGCRRGECASDSDCRHDQSCVDYKCVSSCGLVSQCGSGADCRTRNHVAICSCPAGTTGDALSRCYPMPRPLARAFSL